MSEKRERFVALAESRTEKAASAIRLVGNLANRSNYEYERGEAEQMLAALESELKQVRSRFDAATRGKRTTFVLASGSKGNRNGGAK